MIKITKLFENIISEELLAVKFKDKIDIYHNPGSISKFPVGARAILTENGDLFIADNTGYDIIHSDLIEYLELNRLIPNLSYHNGLLPFRKNTSGNILTLIEQSVTDSDDPNIIKSAKIGIDNFRKNNKSIIRFKLNMFAKPI